MNVDQHSNVCLDFLSYYGLHWTKTAVYIGKVLFCMQLIEIQSHIPHITTPPPNTA